MTTYPIFQCWECKTIFDNPTPEKRPKSCPNCGNPRVLIYTKTE